MTAVTGAAWHIEEDADEIPRPWAWFDMDAILDLPFHWEDWLADKGTTYSSHTVICDAGVTNVASSQSAGVILVRVKQDTMAPMVAGTKYAVTCRIVGVNGEQEDQTLYLKAGAR